VKAGLRLIAHERVIATPHNAFNTEEALERKVAETLSSLEEYIRSGSFPNPVPRE
jgi:phosphoglycerate dehydrogenase-like enzyme